MTLYEPFENRGPSDRPAQHVYALEAAIRLYYRILGKEAHHRLDFRKQHGKEPDRSSSFEFVLIEDADEAREQFEGKL